MGQARPGKQQNHLAPVHSQQRSQMESDNMRDALPNAGAPSSSGQKGWEWKTHTEKWVESSGKPLFRVVPDDTKPTLRDPLSTSDPTETEHFILRAPPFNK